MKNGETIPQEEDVKILKAAMKNRSMKQLDLAEKMGVFQSTISTNLRRDRIGLDVFVKMLNTMDYDVIVVDRRTGEGIWKVSAKPTPAP